MRQSNNDWSTEEEKLTEIKEEIPLVQTPSNQQDDIIEKEDSPKNELKKFFFEPMKFELKKQ